MIAYITYSANGQWADVPGRNKEDHGSLALFDRSFLNALRSVFLIIATASDRGGRFA